LVIGIDEKKADTVGNTKSIILNLLLEGSKTAGEIADKQKKQLDHILRLKALADQEKYMR
jgi:hypothetical protein